MQTGFGAKAKYLPQLRTEYKGVSWRFVTHKYTQQCITCKMKYYCLVFLALEAMKPSRLLQHYPVSRFLCVLFINCPLDVSVAS